jgi:hypothetical protein
LIWIKFRPTNFLEIGVGDALPDSILWYQKSRYVYEDGPAQDREERGTYMARGDNQDTYLTTPQTIRLSNKTRIYPDQQIIIP